MIMGAGMYYSYAYPRDPHIYYGYVIYHTGYVRAKRAEPGAGVASSSHIRFCKKIIRSKSFKYFDFSCI